MDDLDAALEGLETAEHELDRADTAEVPVVPAEPPPRKVVRKSISPETYESRESFPNLLEADPTPALGRRASPEEKLESLRARVKFAEHQAARFRDAWETREAELDAVEALYARARDELESLTREHNSLQTEHEEFVASTQKELKQRAREVERLRWERDKVQDQVPEISEEDLSKLKRQVDGLKYELEERDTSVDRIKRELAERSMVIKGFKSELEARDEEMSRLQMALRAASQMSKKRDG